MKRSEVGLTVPARDVACLWKEVPASSCEKKEEHKQGRKDGKPEPKRCKDALERFPQPVTGLQHSCNLQGMQCSKQSYSRRILARSAK
mmetsp:Transcript_79768/g.207345  ORF Transcript_79768/g.207345 Transcript_79768/m.207345 type:complete len:88 (-) Transcript_79768:610-873(-)